MAGVERRQIARRQADPARRRQPRDQRRRAPRTGCRSHSALCQFGRKGACHRLDRLRARWPDPPGHYLGQARRAGARSGASKPPALGGEIMRTSSGRILTSHPGSLPRPDALIEANRAREAGEATDERAFQQTLNTAVGDAVRRQKELGIDVPGDGEFGKSVGNRVNYGAWWNYAFQRLGGLELGGPNLDHMTARRARPGEIVLTNAASRRDRVRFVAAYADPVSGVFMGPRPATGPVCVGPLTYTGRSEE